MRRLLVALFAVGLAVGCGQSPTDNDEESSQQQDQQDEEDDDDSTWSSVSGPGPVGWAELDPGLVDDIAVYDDGVGTWIERGDEQLGACGEHLGADDDSEGLAVMRPNTTEITDDGEVENQEGDENDFSNGDDDGQETDDLLPDVDEIAERADVDDSPTPVYLTDLNGWVRDFDEDDQFARLLEVRHWDTLPDVEVDVCGTVYRRGDCYVPTEEFGSGGCASATELDPARVPAGLEADDDGQSWELEVELSERCQHGDNRTEEHPEDLEVGVQQIKIDDVDEFPEAEVVDIDGEDVEWRASYLESRSDPVMNPGGVSCTWDLHEIDELDRAVAIVEDDRVYLDLKGAGESREFFVWGEFEVQ